MKPWEEAFDELYEIGFSDMDPRTTDILGCHALLERALDLFFERVLPRSDRLFGMGFGQKIGLWGALVPLSDEIITPVVKSLIRYNDLRNTVAHGDPTDKIDKAVAKLLTGLPPVMQVTPPDLDSAGSFLLGTIAAASDHLGT